MKESEAQKRLGRWRKWWWLGAAGGVLLPAGLFFAGFDVDFRLFLPFQLLLAIATLAELIHWTARLPGGLKGWRLGLLLLPYVNVFWAGIESGRTARAVPPGQKPLGRFFSDLLSDLAWTPLCLALFVKPAAFFAASRQAESLEWLVLHSDAVLWGLVCAWALLYPALTRRVRNYVWRLAVEPWPRRRVFREAAAMLLIPLALWGGWRAAAEYRIHRALERLSVYGVAPDRRWEQSLPMALKLYAGAPAEIREWRTRFGAFGTKRIIDAAETNDPEVAELVDQAEEWGDWKNDTWLKTQVCYYWGTRLDQAFSRDDDREKASAFERLLRCSLLVGEPVAVEILYRKISSDELSWCPDALLESAIAMTGEAALEKSIAVEASMIAGRVLPEAVPAQREEYSPWLMSWDIGTGLPWHPEVAAAMLEVLADFFDGEVGGFMTGEYRFWSDLCRWVPVEELNSFVIYNTERARLVRITMALELYRREHGRLPETLEALPPEVMENGDNYVYSLDESGTSGELRGGRFQSIRVGSDGDGPRG